MVIQIVKCLWGLCGQNIFFKVLNMILWVTNYSVKAKFKYLNFNFFVHADRSLCLKGVIIA